MAATFPWRPGCWRRLAASPGYPAGSELRRLPALLAQAGLLLVRDERRRFGCRLGGRAGAAEFLSSLYLPGLPAARSRLAGAYLRLLARLGAELPVPLRRIIAVKPA